MSDSMTYGNLGHSGLKLSRIGLGSWLTFGTDVDEQTTERCVRTALDAGINFIDTADIYALGEAETVLGKVLSDLFGARKGSVRRQDLVIATKAFWPMSDNVNDRGLSRKHLFESIHNSLRRLKIDYVDLYQCHRYDPETPVEETVRAMDALIRQGKVLYWGVSCWTAAQITDAVRTARALGAVPPVSNQPPYNMIDRGIEVDILSTSAREGLSQVVFSPLAQGLLTGKYTSKTPPAGTRAADERLGRFLRPTLTEENFQRVERLAALAAGMDMPLSQLALAWCLRQENVTSVIIGATRPEQVSENAGAASRSLSADTLEHIEAILDNDPTAPQD
jgi:voltage-dependent potassium channel beta subunit